MDIPSPFEGMIYYMGELTRAQIKRKLITYQRIYHPKPEKNCKTDVPTIVEAADKLDPCLVPLFVAWTGVGAAEIATEHNRVRYFVPAGKKGDRYLAGQSLLVMALVRQLFNLSTSREDLPSTQSVVVTGGG